MDFVFQLMTSQRKLYMVGICSTIPKGAKRTSDTIVESTHLLLLSFSLPFIFISTFTQVSFHSDKEEGLSDQDT